MSWRAPLLSWSSLFSSSVKLDCKVLEVLSLFELSLIELVCLVKIIATMKWLIFVVLEVPSAQSRREASDKLLEYSIDQRSEFEIDRKVN